MNEQEAIAALPDYVESGIVAANFPSKIKNTYGFHVCTYDDIQDYAERPDVVALIFPLKSTLLRVVRQRNETHHKTYAILEMNKHFTAEEALVKAADYLGEGKYFLQSITQLIPPGGGRKKQKNCPVLLSFDSASPPAGDEVAISWFPRFCMDDFILPRDYVSEIRLNDKLKTFPCVKDIVVDIRHGCHCPNLGNDSVTLRVYYTKHPSMARYHSYMDEVIGGAMRKKVGEVQSRRCSPWDRKTAGDFRAFSTCDLKGYSGAQTEQIIISLRVHAVRHYLMTATRLVVEGTGNFLNQLRLHLLTQNISLPFGERQGSFQIGVKTNRKHAQSREAQREPTTATHNNRTNGHNTKTTKTSSTHANTQSQHSKANTKPPPREQETNNHHTKAPTQQQNHQTHTHNTQQTPKTGKLTLAIGETLQVESCTSLLS